MAKNTNISGFRKIDIDKYDPESYQDDELNVNQIDEQGPNASEVNGLLSSKRSSDALQAVLNNPPLNTKNQQTKDAAFQLVMRVLKSFQNSAEIENAVKSLNEDAVDVLMKYIYRGFEREPRDSSILLTWHEKVYAVGGNGCIVRVLSDGRRV